VSSPARKIVRGDGLAWLAAHPAEAGMSIVTSMPDVSEMPDRDLEKWRAWTLDAARALIRWVPDDGVAIFFQSDVRHGGAWIDKSAFVTRAAAAENAILIWHKIVCRVPAGTVSYARAGYSHMLCVSRIERPAEKRPGPDVLLGTGFKPWSKAMGVDACLYVCRYLRDETTTRTVVDPFCGHGTVLAVANAFGFDAIGVDIGIRKVKAARRLKLEIPQDDG
jgi:hypothetical protein